MPDMNLVKCIYMPANFLFHIYMHTYCVHIMSYRLSYYEWYFNSSVCGIIVAIVMGPINENNEHRCYKFGVMTCAMNTSSCEMYLYATPLETEEHD